MFWTCIVLFIVIFMAARRLGPTAESLAARFAHVQDFGPKTTLAMPVKRFLSCLGPWMLILVAAWFCAVRFAVGHWGPVDAIIGVGLVLTWPVQEWLIHVLVLHLKPKRLLGVTVDPLISQFHRVHHANPWSAELGLAPPHVTILYVLGIPLMWWAASALHPGWLTGIAVTLSLALWYEWAHFLMHTSYAPRTAWFRRRRQQHHLHHFKSEHYWFGVTTIAGDEMLRTRPAPAAVETSPTCCNLEGTDA